MLQPRVNQFSHGDASLVQGALWKFNSYLLNLRSAPAKSGNKLCFPLQHLHLTHLAVHISQAQSSLTNPDLGYESGQEFPQSFLSTQKTNESTNNQKD